ncbi:hypothetical protein ZIOFF_039557 [Zingiber officinale]|uniref:Deoxyuridine 5'-triphosphate nucleotidohydrolase n=1 Tax=Zingiber officinale TaxID=94328 RepID=A0A8J5L3Y2_ZINOF|nr:hypothetical protein ZIOFF_039557 [Zingiber officinale]
MQERASIVPAEVLYHSRRDGAHHRAYVHRSEEAMLVPDNHQADRSFIQEESFHQLRRSGMQYIHLGVLQAVLPKRQTEGSGGLDIAASHASIIEPYGRDLVHTGLQMEIPYRYYGRIASRSGLAWKSGIEVGAGVIDSDF